MSMEIVIVGHCSVIIRFLGNVLQVCPCIVVCLAFHLYDVCMLCTVYYLLQKKQTRFTLHHCTLSREIKVPH